MRNRVILGAGALAGAKPVDPAGGDELRGRVELSRSLEDD